MPSKRKTDPDFLPKFLIYSYILLWIFEGALRKWVFPDLATPLLIIRDPILLMIYGIALSRNCFPSNGYMLVLGLIAMFGVIFSGFSEYTKSVVTLFGIRANFLHLPLIFIIPRFFYREDVIRVGKLFMWISIPMTSIIVFQFLSPQSAWINQTVGGGEGGGLSGALGRFRPPGTFSFINGVVAFYTAMAAFILGLHFDRVKLWMPLFWASSVCVFIAIPVSISRSLLLSVVIVVGFVLLGLFVQGKTSGKLFRFLLIGVIAAIIAAQFEVFDIGTDAFSARWELSTTKKGGMEEAILGRFLADTFGPFLNLFDNPFFGYGIGVGTNAGAKLLTGSRSFLISEGEVGRILGEMGPLLGLAFMAYRFILGFDVAKTAFRRLSYGSLLSWTLLGASVLMFVSGQWGQPTTQGYAMFMFGLVLAARSDREELQLKKKQTKEAQ